MFDIIVAATSDNGIGYQGTIPWRIPADMFNFKKLTLGKVVIMGRATWESLSLRLRPLPNRVNVVLTSFEINNIPCFEMLSEALEFAQEYHPDKNVMIIGGSRLYAEALRYDECNTVYLTRVETTSIICDRFIPDLKTLGFREIFSSNVQDSGAYKFRFTQWKKFQHDEYQYLDLVKDVLDNGVNSADRTGTGTLSVFGRQMRFSLENGTLPLLTTKHVSFTNIVKELLWFIAGETNSNLLSENGVHIWDENGSREFLDSRGLSTNEQGDLGPVYGFQWRFSGANYINCHEKPMFGIDQLAKCIEQIQTDPTSRRIILCAWNPSQLDQMALPPCHILAQFYVRNGMLSCQLYQRSADIGLGVPYNIASYALLTHMIAHVCQLQAGEFVHVLGDAHIYDNHLNAMHLQLTRMPRPFPTLTINQQRFTIDEFLESDFQLLNYNPHKKIKMRMSV